MCLIDYEMTVSSRIELLQGFDNLHQRGESAIHAIQAFDCHKQAILP
jgi:hypothetical protein